MSHLTVFDILLALPARLQYRLGLAMRCLGSLHRVDAFCFRIGAIPQPIFQHRFQHLRQRHSGEAECIGIHRKSIGKEARLAFNRFQHLLQRHSGEAERMKIRWKFIVKEARLPFRHRFQNSTAEPLWRRQNVWKHTGNPQENGRGRLFNIDSNTY